MKYTNKHNLSLAASVFLLDDDYDYVPNAISTTSLMKPVRAISLLPKVDRDNLEYDVSDFLASRMGQAIHSAVELAWTRNYKRILPKLGYTEKQIERIVINPNEQDIANKCIPVYFEQRASKELLGYTITGKYDMVFNGMVRDIKTTSVWTYIKDTKTEDYILQLSIYRWLNPEIITSDIAEIDFYFTDFQKSNVGKIPHYPEVKAKTIQITLMSLEETEAWLINRISLIQRNKSLPQNLLPKCDSTELWIGDSTYRYFADPSKTSGRATRVFNNILEATQFKTKAGKGVVIEVKSKAKACIYCPVKTVCEQRKDLILQGLLDDEEDS